MNYKELAHKLFEIIEKKKIDEIQIVDVHEITSITDVFIMVTVSNMRMTKALADEIEFKMEENYHMRVLQKEGYDSGTWILLDYDHVIVHILHTEAAEFYGLDRLWKDGGQIEFTTTETIK